MKHFFNLSREYSLLFLQIFFIALFVLVLLAYNLDIAQKNFLESRMYSENVRGIQMGVQTGDVPDKNVEVQIPKVPNTDFMMYKHLSDGNEIWRGVYGTGDLFGYSAYIDQGRFLVPRITGVKHRPLL